MVELGDRVKDQISGLEGIVIAITNWLYGCQRVTIQPEKAKDGKPSDNYTIDEPQCKILKKGVLKHAQPIDTPKEKRSHGDRQTIKRNVDPTDR